MIYLDAQEVYSSDEHNFSISREKFLLISDLWIALMQGKSIERSYNHIAFHIDEDELPSYEFKIKNMNWTYCQVDHGMKGKQNPFIFTITTIIFLSCIPALSGMLAVSTKEKI